MLIPSAGPNWLRPLVVLVCGSLLAIVGLTYALGWLTGSSALSHLMPLPGVMKFNTSLCFWLLGSSVCVAGFRLVRNADEPVDHMLQAGAVTATCLIALVAVLTFAQDALDLDFGLDQRVVRDTEHETRPGRMAPITAVIFVLLAANLVCLHLGRWLDSAQFMTALTLILAMMCALNYWYGLEAWPRIVPISTGTPLTAMLLLVAALGVLAASPPRGVLELMVADSVSGQIVRTLLPPAIIMPVLVNGLRLMGQRAGWFDSEFGTAAFALVNIVLFTGLILWAASLMQLADARREQTQEALRASERIYRAIGETINYGVWICNPDGKNTYISPSFLELVGLTQQQCSDFGWGSVLHPDDAEQTIVAWQECVRGRGRWSKVHRFRGRDGQWHPVLAVGVPVYDSAGAVTCWAGINLDIQQLHAAEEQLRELNATLERRVAERSAVAEASARLLDGVLEALPVAVNIADPAGKLTRFNGEFEGVWGPTPKSDNINEYQEWIGYWPETGARIQAQEWPMARALLAGERCAGKLVEYERFDDHRRRFIMVSAAPVYEPGGAIAAGVVVSVDVTERILAERALRESEERFRSAFDFAAIGKALVALDGRWLRVNRALCEILGYTESELLASDYQTITHPDDLAGDLALVADMLSGKIRTYQLEKRYFHRQGSIVHALLAVSLVRDEQGTPLYFVSQLQDISQRKQIEQALEASEALLRQFIKHSPVALAMFDRDMRYLQCSDRWMVTYRLQGQDILGASHYAIFPEIPERWKTVHQRVLAGSVESCDEDPFHRADGSVEWEQWECQPWRNAAGEIGGMIIFTQTITERKRAEERIKASLREKDVLLKEIHHRVKNNLQIVSSLLDLQASFTHDPQTLEMFQESRGRVKSMALIHERLYRSYDMARVNFAEYVQQLAEDLSRTYRVATEHVRLDVQVELPPLPIDIAIPCGLLLNELLSNCFKHAFRARQEGCVQVRLYRTVDATNVLVVSDNGVGFPATTDFRNTASFGLELVNTLVDQLRGHIELNVAAGTTFTIRFPAAHG